MARLDGKIAIVTGGTQGLGAATARLFAERGAEGIVICGRNQEKGAAVASSISGCPVHFVTADLSKVDDCRKVVAEADAKFGRIDCLVNAGATTARGDILDTTPELYDEIMDINLKGPFFLIQETLKVMMREKTEGSIVNIGSTSAHVGQHFLTPYSVSKGALAVLTKNVAAAVMRQKIRVNCLHIGWMESDQEKALHAAQGHGPEWFAERSAEQPFGRLLQPSEVANAIAFLCSDDSGMMTGTAFDFDQSITGAREAYPASPKRAV